MNIPSTPGREYQPLYNREPSAGKSVQRTRGYTDLMARAWASRGNEQNGGNAVDQPAGGADASGVVHNPEMKYSMRGDDILLWAPGPGCIFSGGGDGQSAYIEYTADSTPEAPIVRISGRSLSGDYTQTVHLNDIDPRSATYPEICALLAHQKYLAGDILPNGMSVYRPDSGMEYHLPSGLEKGDFTQRRDFLSALQKELDEDRLNGGTELTDVLQRMMELFEELMERQKKSGEDKKLDDLLGVKDPEEGFWEARARRQEEYQTLREEEARKARILERLRAGEPVSAAELLLL